MFVSKKRYNELKGQLEMREHQIEMMYRRKSEYDQKIKELEDRELPEGRRLTEEELSTLIAVDLIKILYKEAEEAPTFSVSDKEQNVFYGIDDLEKGLFNG